MKNLGHYSLPFSFLSVQCVFSTETRWTQIKVNIWQLVFGALKPHRTICLHFFFCAYKTIVKSHVEEKVFVFLAVSSTEGWLSMQFSKQQTIAYMCDGNRDFLFTWILRINLFILWKQWQYYKWLHELQIPCVGSTVE